MLFYFLFGGNHSICFRCLNIPLPFCHKKEGKKENEKGFIILDLKSNSTTGTSSPHSLQHTFASDGEKEVCKIKSHRLLTYKLSSKYLRIGRFNNNLCTNKNESKNVEKIFQYFFRIYPVHLDAYSWLRNASATWHNLQSHQPWQPHPCHG